MRNRIRTYVAHETCVFRRDFTTYELSGTMGHMGDTRTTLERALDDEKQRQREHEEDAPVRRDFRIPPDIDDELRRVATQHSMPVNRLVVATLRAVFIGGR